jgi:hypothetical protein
LRLAAAYPHLLAVHHMMSWRFKGETLNISRGFWAMLFR